MKTSKQGIDFIKGFESFVPYVYDDLIPARKGTYRRWEPGDGVRGTLTCLYGHTDSARHPLKMKDAVGKVYTEQFGCEVLAVDLSECEEAVERLVKVPLTQGQFDALVSLTFNMGEGNLRKSSLLSKLNRGDYKGARAAFDLYVKSKGQTLRGLQRRRDGEQVLWDSDIPVVPAEPVDHPAEVDAPPKVTEKDLAKISRKARWIRNMRRVWDSITFTSILGALGIATDTAGQVKQIVSLEVLVAIITTGILMTLFFKYIQSLLREDVEEGRATPSGEAEAA